MKKLFLFAITAGLIANSFAGTAVKLSGNSSMNSFDSDYNQGDKIHMQVNLEADEAINAEKSVWQIRNGETVIAEGELHSANFGELRAELNTNHLPAGDYTWIAQVYEGSETIFEATVPVSVNGGSAALGAK